MLLNATNSLATAYECGRVQVDRQTVVFVIRVVFVVLIFGLVSTATAAFARPLLYDEISDRFDVRY